KIAQYGDDDNRATFAGRESGPAPSADFPADLLPGDTGEDAKSNGTGKQLPHIPAQVGGGSGRHNQQRVDEQCPDGEQANIDEDREDHNQEVVQEYGADATRPAQGSAKAGEDQRVVHKIQNNSNTSGEQQEMCDVLVFKGDQVAEEEILGWHEAPGCPGLE